MYAKLSLNLVTVQDDQKAMANLEARAANAREMNAHDSTTDPQVSCLHDLMMAYAI